MRAAVSRNLEGKGIILHPQTNLTELTKSEEGIKVITDHGEELVADVVLFATGCVPNTKRLNLQAAGVVLRLDKLVAVKHTTTFCVGFTEEEAVQQANGDILIYTSSFNPMRNTIAG
ncbi:hypothetical protein QQ045_024890 [Rhodiola kirilowii]